MTSRAVLMARLPVSLTSRLRQGTQYLDSILQCTCRNMNCVIVNCQSRVKNPLQISSYCATTAVVPLMSRDLPARLRIPTDVAGATFMAAGSSMPTLFIAIASVFLGEGDIGLGTIIGSTMFNILFITAVCGLCSGLVITLTPWPMVRDSCVYIVNLLVLLFAIHDNEVHWYEAAVFPVLYSGYIVVMCYNRSLEKGFDAVRGKCFKQGGDDEVQMEDPLEIVSQLQEKPQGTDRSAADQREGNEIEDEETSETRTTQAEGGENEKDSSPIQDLELADNKTTESKETAVGNQLSHDESSSEPRGLGVPSKSGEDVVDPGPASSFSHTSPFQAPSGAIRKTFWAVMLPVQALYFVSMPDCRQKAWEAWYPLTFVMSIIWMALLSYVLVWTVSIMGETFGVPECIMGLTLLAAGSSVPDAVASLVVAKHGMGDMALANCVGSNIFDILCLGLPWFLATTVINPGSTVLIHSGHAVYTSLCLFGTVLTAFCAIHFNKWKLDKRLGAVMMLVYLVFLTCAVILEALPSGPTEHSGHGPKLSPHHPGREPHRGLAHGAHHGRLHAHHKKTSWRPWKVPSQVVKGAHFPWKSLGNSNQEGGNA